MSPPTLESSWFFREAGRAPNLASHCGSMLTKRSFASSPSFPSTPGRRWRIAVDVSIGSLMLGQHAEALVDVAPTAG